MREGGAEEDYRDEEKEQKNIGRGKRKKDVVVVGILVLIMIIIFYQCRMVYKIHICKYESHI